LSNVEIFFLKKVQNRTEIFEEIIMSNSEIMMKKDFWYLGFA